MPQPVVFAREELHAVWDEAQPLLRAHHAEVPTLSDALFAPFRPGYEDLASRGGYVVFTMRTEERPGSLVGYNGFIISNHYHYPAIRVAMQDALYVMPEYRGALTQEFISFVDTFLKALGANAVVRSMANGKDYSGLLTHLAYRKGEVSYLKEI